LHEIDDSIASCTEAPDDLEFFGRFLIVRRAGGCDTGAYGNSTNRLALKKATFAY